MTVIALCGWIGSGKDSVADFLVNDHGFKRMSFAGTLKDSIASIFGWDREMLNGTTHEGRAWREKVDPWWSARLNIPNLTPRFVLQQWGTEVCRHGFHSDIWVASVENQLRNSKDNIVISDCRFPNEIAAMRAANAMIAWVRRGDLPHWYYTAIKANTGNADAHAEIKLMGIHESEFRWVGSDFDVEINNSGSFNDLQTSVKLLVH